MSLIHQSVVFQLHDTERTNKKLFVTQPRPAQKKKILAFISLIHELVSVTDGKLIINNERGISSVNVWLAASDSSSPFHLILPSAFNSIHLPSVSASKSVLHLLHNTAPCEDREVLSTIQIYSATPTVHLRSLTWMPYLEPVPFMHFVSLLSSWFPNTAAEPQRKPCGHLCNVLVICVFSLSSL